MPPEPRYKRVDCFFDGQNLYYAAKNAFGHPFPTYDPLALATRVCQSQGWTPAKIFFYTGIHSASQNPYWHQYWSAKLATMATRGIEIYSRPLKYRPQTVQLPDGTETSVLVGQEKGIDVHLALDVVLRAFRQEFDVAVIFSQDQDLSEVADKVREISITQNRWIQVASAFPNSPAYDVRGINKTKWIKIDLPTYNACLDPHDYRPKKTTGGNP